MKASNCVVKLNPGCPEQFALPRGLSSEVIEQRRKAIIQFVKATCNTDLIDNQTKAVFPRDANGAPFWILAFASEPLARNARLSYWPKFKAAGMFITQDLTPFQRSLRNKIKDVVCPYWGVESIP